MCVFLFYTLIDSLYNVDRGKDIAIECLGLDINRIMTLIAIFLLSATFLKTVIFDSRYYP